MQGCQSLTFRIPVATSRAKSSQRSRCFLSTNLSTRGVLSTIDPVEFVFFSFFIFFAFFYVKIMFFTFFSFL